MSDSFDTRSPEIAIRQVHASRGLDEARVRRLVQHIIAEEGCMLRHLSLILADRDTVLRLNRTYLGHNHPTDVLSFPLTEEEGVVEGEVYVDLDTAAERHGEFDATFEEEACRYVIHGLLHLMGYDDATSGEQTTMRTREDRYLEAFGC